MNTYIPWTTLRHIGTFYIYAHLCIPYMYMTAIESKLFPEGTCVEFEATWQTSSAKLNHLEILSKIDYLTSYCK